MIAIASVIIVITPISWILLHQPQNDPADASVPIVTRTDDTYITPSAKSVVATPTPHPSTTAPTTTPTTTPTGTPTDSATPTTVPTTTGPTDAPTTAPTRGRLTEAPTTQPTDPGSTTPPDQPTPTAPTPTSTRTTNNPPPPPVQDGDMDSDEIQLFNLIDNARVNNGCRRLEQDPNLTRGAESEAGDRANSGSVNSSGSSKSTAGGNSWSAQQAYDQIMAQSRSTVLNCGLTTLGVGRDTHQYCTAVDLLGICLGSKPTRVAWVADFS
ncbi:hypothetical protein [Kribbella sp. NPDC055071]